MWVCEKLRSGAAGALEAGSRGIGMRYIVLCENSPNELVSRVVDHLNRGWQLQGGVSASPLDDAEYPRVTLRYSQATKLLPAG